MWGRKKTMNIKDEAKAMAKIMGEPETLEAAKRLHEELYGKPEQRRAKCIGFEDLSFEVESVSRNGLVTGVLRDCDGQITSESWNIICNSQPKVGDILSVTMTFHG